ncbi:MAG: hypothetical protein J7M18_07325, partial [Candidatus Eremiobacteraeota bacterium]|nr:hypothetical protein [Candidatus Eremiobacteraeota bacterium]
MKTEPAIFIREPEQIPTLSGNFDRTYFGEEFCEDLMPSFTQIRSAYNAANARGMKFTLLTPLCSDEGLEKILDILIRLSDDGITGEVVFSDWGLLNEITSYRKNDIPWEPVLGRAMTRQKTGPRITLVSD